MICKACESADTRVVSTEQRGNVVARRRQCNDCGERWTTHEVHEQDLCALHRAAEMLKSLGAFFLELKNG